MLATVIDRAGNAFVVIDALDECSPSIRQELLQELSLIPVKSGIHLLVTSRYLGDIEEQLENVFRVEVLAPEEDLKIYALGCADEYSVLQTRFKALSEVLIERILSKIAQSAAGM